MSKDGVSIVLLSLFITGATVAIAATAQMNWKHKVLVSLFLTAGGFISLARVIFPGIAGPAW
jgi:hypothetical protein